MIVLDTHALVWLISNPEKLSEKANKAIQKEIRDGRQILVSTISIWEICLMVKKGRLRLTMDTDTWIEKIEGLPFLQFVPLDNKIAAKSVNLPGTLHDDPADRIIIATAWQNGGILITFDQRILTYPHVQSLW